MKLEMCEHGEFPLACGVCAGEPPSSARHGVQEGTNDEHVAVLSEEDEMGVCSCCGEPSIEDPCEGCRQDGEDAESMLDPAGGDDGWD